MISSTRTLVAAGLPGYFWSMAAPCYMRLGNCVPRPSGKPSPWLQRYGEEVKGALVPCGSGAICKPSPTKGRIDKPLPAGTCGICSGYRFAPGGTWSGE